MNDATLPVLIQSLLKPESYIHPVAHTELIETHISWVILTGEFAYKLKKPVNLGFLDFSTLEKRKFACEEELRLNARFAPELYLEVMPVTGSPENPGPGGAGPAIEYALRMREFDQGLQMDRLLTHGAIGNDELSTAFRAFGKRLARFHGRLPPDVKSSFGNPDLVCAAAKANFEHLGQLRAHGDIGEQIASLHSWTRDSCEHFSETIEARKTSGHVRECHGDLHLRNLVLLDRGIVAFDCIEFSKSLRWIDVICDIAFLFMDLCFHERDDLAFDFLNAWLAEAGDYEGLALLRFYGVYRAMVRAKIAGIELLQEGWTEASGEPAHADHLAALDRHLKLAENLSHADRAMLIITHGVSGSGKSWLASRLAVELGAVHARSDVERKRLYGLAPEAHSAENQKAEIYGQQASEKTYARLLEIAQCCVQASLPVIIDATFLKKSARQDFQHLAEKMSVPFVILDCRAEPQTLRERILKRQDRGRDASEADTAVLDLQLGKQEALTDDERRYVLEADTERLGDLTTLISRIKSALQKI